MWQDTSGLPREFGTRQQNRPRDREPASWLEPWALGAHATLALALETALEVAVDAKVVVVDREHALAVAGALSQRRREGGGMLFVHALVKDKSQCNIEPTPRVCMQVAVASSRTLQLLAKCLSGGEKLQRSRLHHDGDGAAGGYTMRRGTLSKSGTLKTTETFLKRQLKDPQIHELHVGTRTRWPW